MLGVKGGELDGTVYGDPKELAKMFITFFKEQPKMREMIKKFIMHTEVMELQKKFERVETYSKERDMDLRGSSIISLSLLKDAVEVNINRRALKDMPGPAAIRILDGLKSAVDSVFEIRGIGAVNTAAKELVRRHKERGPIEKGK